MKKTLTVVTPVGTFTRRTDATYAFVCVWDSPHARAVLARLAAAGRKPCGVDARWAKDNGYATTWHTSERTAVNASAKYMWDDAAKLVGIFPVSVS